MTLWYATIKLSSLCCAWAFNCINLSNMNCDEGMLVWWSLCLVCKPNKQGLNHDSTTFWHVISLDKKEVTHIVSHFIDSLCKAITCDNNHILVTREYWFARQNCSYILYSFCDDVIWMTIVGETYGQAVTVYTIRKLCLILWKWKD